MLLLWDYGFVPASKSSAMGLWFWDASKNLNFFGFFRISCLFNYSQECYYPTSAQGIMDLGDPECLLDCPWAEDR